MTGEQTFLVTGFKKVPVKKREKRQEEKEQNPSVQFYVNIICREDLELESRKKNLWYLLGTRLLCELHKML